MSNRENTKFTKWDNYYDQDSSRDFAYLSPEQVDTILTEADVPSGKVLDLGCGAGQFDEQLHSRGFEVVGIDGANQAIEKAKQRNPDVRYLGLNLEEPFPEDLQDEVFDLAVCKFVLAFINNREEFINKIKNLLHEKGVLVVISTSLDQASLENQTIAVDLNDTVNLLKTRFSNVSHYTINNDDLTVFIAKN